MPDTSYLTDEMRQVLASELYPEFLKLVRGVYDKEKSKLERHRGEKVKYLKKQIYQAFDIKIT